MCIGANMSVITAGAILAFAIDELENAEDADLRASVDPVAAHHHDVEISFSLLRGHPVPALIEAGHAARLTVVGAHHKRGPIALGVGYIVRNLLSHATTPVAVVPISAERAAPRRRCEE